MIGTVAYLASDDVTDLHEVVVDHVGKVVRWKAIILQDHLVVNILVVKDDFSVHDVFELCLARRDLHTDDE